MKQLLLFLALACCLSLTPCFGQQSATLAGGFTYLPPPPPTITAIAPSSGLATGGTLVTITGTDFQQGATVGFKAATDLAPSPCANVKVLSATQITCNTPAHAVGVVDVIVTNPK